MLCLLTPAALVLAVLVVVVSPLVLVYLLFDRFCGLVEEFKPTRKRSKRKDRGGSVKMIQSIFQRLSSAKDVNDKKRGQIEISP